MKILKLKSLFFGLMAILTVSVFLTSCEQEDIILETTDNLIEKIEFETTTQTENGLNIWLPESIVSQGEEVVKTHISGMTPDEMTQAAKDFATIQFVNDQDKLDLFQDYIIENGNLRNADLSEHLSINELEDLRAELDTYTLEEVAERCDELVCYWVSQIVGTTWYIYRVCYWI